MTLTRLLTNLLLVLALVASGPMPASAADETPAAAPCHDLGPPSAHDAADEGSECCGGAPAYCGCDCVHQGAAAVSWAGGPLAQMPVPRDGPFATDAPPLSAASPETRPPIA